MFTSLPPLAGASEIPLTVTAKERMEVPGGGANGTAASVKLTVALPPPQFPPGQGLPVSGPLQAARENEASKRTRSRDLFRIITHPARLVRDCHSWK